MNYNDTAPTIVTPQDIDNETADKASEYIAQQVGIGVTLANGGLKPSDHDMAEYGHQLVFDHTDEDKDPHHLTRFFWKGQEFLRIISTEDGVGHEFIGPAAIGRNTR